MRTLFFLSVALFFVGCQQREKQYFESSPEIDLVKNNFKAYLNKDWDTFRSFYADTARFAGNVWEPAQFITLDKFLELEKSGAEIFTGTKISNDIVYCMIINDKGEKWVLTWCNFSAKTKNGTEVAIPFHQGFRFVGDKVVFQFAYYNELPLFLALQPADSASKK